MEALTLNDFVQDYQRLVSLYGDKPITAGMVEKLIHRFYGHIQIECYNWLLENKQ